MTAGEAAPYAASPASGQRERHASATFPSVLGPDSPALRLHEAACDRQAEPCVRRPRATEPGRRARTARTSGARASARQADARNPRRRCAPRRRPARAKTTTEPSDGVCRSAFASRFQSTRANMLWRTCNLGQSAVDARLAAARGARARLLRARAHNLTTTSPTDRRSELERRERRHRFAPARTGRRSTSPRRCVCSRSTGTYSSASATSVLDRLQHGPDRRDRCAQIVARPRHEFPPRIEHLLERRGHLVQRRGRGAPALRARFAARAQQGRPTRARRPCRRALRSGSRPSAEQEGDNQCRCPARGRDVRGRQGPRASSSSPVRPR